MKRLGALVPVVTPCSKDGQPDLTGLKNVCRYVLEAGCHGIFVLGSTGRGPWFGRADRVRICQAAKEQISENIPLFAGCTALGMTDMLENAQSMADAGATAVVLTCPGYFNYNKGETETIFLTFADRSPLPVMIYDIPAFTGTKLNTEMISRLARHKNIIGFKDSSADIDRFRQLLSVFEGMGDFYLIQGKEHLLAESVLKGGSGLTVSLLHISPQPFVGLYNAAMAGDEDAAHACQQRVKRIMEIVVESLQRRPEISTLFHILNCALRTNGVCDNILLQHEGNCPDWLAENAAQAASV